MLEAVSEYMSDNISEKNNLVTNSKQTMNKQLINIMQKESFAICSRAFAAIVGGYALSYLIAVILSYLLPSEGGGGVMTGMLVSYALYAIVIIWIFSVKSLQRVWITLITSCLVCTIFAYLLMPEGVL